MFEQTCTHTWQVNWTYVLTPPWTGIHAYATWSPRLTRGPYQTRGTRRTWSTCSRSRGKSSQTYWLWYRICLRWRHGDAKDNDSVVLCSALGQSHSSNHPKAVVKLPILLLLLLDELGRSNALPTKPPSTVKAPSKTPPQPSGSIVI